MSWGSLLGTEKRRFLRPLTPATINASHCSELSTLICIQSLCAIRPDVLLMSQESELGPVKVCALSSGSSSAASCWKVSLVFLQCSGVHLYRVLCVHNNCTFSHTQAFPARFHHLLIFSVSVVLPSIHWIFLSCFFSSLLLFVHFYCIFQAITLNITSRSRDRERQDPSPRQLGMSTSMAVTSLASEETVNWGFFLENVLKIKSELY